MVGGVYCLYRVRYSWRKNLIGGLNLNFSYINLQKERFSQ